MRYRILVSSLWTAGSIIVLLQASPGQALLVGMPAHELDANEVKLDKTPPGQVGISQVAITRGHQTPAGVSQEDSDVGSASLYLVVPTDNRTAAQSMGYRIRVVGGCVPMRLELPSGDVRAIDLNDGRSFLVLYWTDVPPPAHEPIQFQVAVAAVDLAGNVGADTVVDVGAPAGCPAGQQRCSDGLCRASEQACAAALTGCAAGARRCADGKCRPVEQSCNGGTVCRAGTRKCSGQAQCCGPVPGGCCESCAPVHGACP